MLKILAGNLVAAHSNVTHMSHDAVDMEAEARTSGEVFLSDHAVDVLKSSALSLQETSETLGMDASKAAADRLLGVIDQFRPIQGGYQLNWNDLMGFRTGTAHLSLCFTDELQARLFFSLPSASVKLVTSDDPPFGEGVANAFPLASEDLAEAAKCLGLSRYTASVFHLMRAMESAVQALATKVGVGHVDKEWGKLLSDIGKAIEVTPKTPERDRWSQSHSHLYHVKQAWRNDTMHPKKTYTDDEARSVYAAVKSFMTHLAALV